MRGEQAGVGPGAVRVGDDDVGGDGLAALQHHPGSAPGGNRDALDGGARPDCAASVRHQPGQAADQRARATQRVMHAPAALEEGDQRVDGAGAERIAAHQQRVEGQHGAQALVLDVAAHGGMHAAMAAQPQQGGQHAHHVGQAVERDVAELFKADAVDRLRLGHEAVVAGHVGRGEAGDLGAHGGRVAGVVELAAVGEADAVERRHRNQRHVRSQGAAAELPQLLEQEGGGDDGWPGVESEAVLAMHLGAPARLVAALQHRHAPAPRTQPHRRGQAAKPAADHHRMRAAWGSDPGEGRHTSCSAAVSSGPATRLRTWCRAKPSTSTSTGMLSPITRSVSSQSQPATLRPLERSPISPPT